MLPWRCLRRPRRLRAALGFGPLVIAALAAVAPASCAIRVGSGAPPDEVTVPSACAASGKVAKLPFGKGSEAFSFVWDTDHFVVAYADPSTGAGDIYVARVNPDGTMLAAPVVVQSTPAKSDLPNLLKTPKGYLVAWQEGTAGSAVFVHALGPDATPVGSGATVATTQTAQSRPVLAEAPGGKAAISWMDSQQGKDGVQVALVDPRTLDVTGPLRIAEADVDGWPWVAGDDAVLGVAWSDKAASAYDVRFARVDPTSLTLGKDVSMRGNVANDGILPRLARTTFGFLAAWEDTRGGDNQIYMSLVDPAGKRIGGGLVEEEDSGDANWPNISWTGAAAGIVYYQFRSGRPQIFMSFVDATGARVAGLHDLQVSDGTGGWSKYPDVVWTGKAFGVMFVDTRDGAAGLYLQNVTCIAATDAGAPAPGDASTH